MPDAERQFIDLIFRVSKKYASWDPEVIVEVGDYGRITRGKIGLAFWKKRQGIFLKEGNIYKDGLAKKYDIPPPEEHGVDSTEGIFWITSKNAKEVDLAAEILAWVLPFFFCGVSGMTLPTSPDRRRRLCRVKPRLLSNSPPEEEPSSQ